MGDKLDESAFSGGGEAIIQINSDGPFEIKYVNPTDDPSKTN